MVCSWWVCQVRCCSFIKAQWQWGQGRTLDTFFHVAVYRQWMLRKWTSNQQVDSIVLINTFGMWQAKDFIDCKNPLFFCLRIWVVMCRILFLGCSLVDFLDKTEIPFPLLHPLPFQEEDRVSNSRSFSGSGSLLVCWPSWVCRRCSQTMKSKNAPAWWVDYKKVIEVHLECGCCR